MSFNALAQRRRDPRFVLRQGSAHIHFSEPSSGSNGVHCTLPEISSSGVAFELPIQQATFEVGAVVSRVTIRVGGCVLSGDILIRNRREAKSDLIMFGALFYPDTTHCEDRMMCLIAGLAAKA